MTGRIAFLLLVLTSTGLALEIEDLDFKFDHETNRLRQMPTADIPASWFRQQKVDHFNHQDKRIWEQRYYADARFYIPGGPVFLRIGGQYALSPPFFGGSFESSYPGITNLTRHFGAIKFSVEHRFYGKSLPFGSDMSIQALQYLSSQQALEDIAYFIQKVIREQYGLTNVPIVTAGESYSGGLAVWFR